MSAIQAAIRRYIRALLGPDLKSDVNRLLEYGPRSRLMDVQRNAVLGSTGRGFSGLAITPEAALVPGAFFGIPYSDSAPDGWGEPLEPPPGVPGGDHPQRIWRSDGGAWTLENQLDWEAALPGGWQSGNVSWTGSGGITVSWNWRPLGGGDQSNASKYHIKTEDFIDWIADQQSRDLSLQARIYCNGRRIATMPAFLSSRSPAVIGAAILGDYLVAVGVDVFEYSRGNTSTLANRSVFGYWEIQPHADGGIEIVPGAQFQQLTILREYEWTQVWAWSDDGTLSASLRGNVGDPEGRYVIQRGTWSLGPTPSVDLSAQFEPTRRNEFEIEGTTNTVDTCAPNDPPETDTVTYTCTGNYLVDPDGISGPAMRSFADYTRVGDSNASGDAGGLHLTQDLKEDPAHDRHPVAIDFQGNEEKLAELVFKCTSLIDSHLVGDAWAKITWDLASSIDWEPDPEQGDFGIGEFINLGGHGTETHSEYRQLDAWINGSLNFSVELEVGGEVKAVLGSVNEVYDFTWQSEIYTRTRIENRDPNQGVPTLVSAAISGCAHNTYIIGFPILGTISDIETGNPNIPWCTSVSFNWDLVPNEMTINSGTIDITRKQGKLLFMDIKEDLYIVYSQVGDYYPGLQVLDPATTEYNTPVGTIDEDSLKVEFKGNELESGAGTPAEDRKKLLQGLPLDTTKISIGVWVADFFDIQHDIGAAIKGSSMLLAAKHPWMVIADGDFTVVKLYNPDADPLALVPASGENQYIGYICRVD